MSETGQPLTCRELVELVSGYLDDALPRDDRRRFEEHLAGCEGCAAYVEQVRDTIRVAGRIAEDAIPPSERDVLLAAFRGWTSAR